MQKQIGANIEDAVNRAWYHFAQCENLEHREECGVAIPEACRKAVPGVRLCIMCQEARDQEAVFFTGHICCGSKNSQLR